MGCWHAKVNAIIIYLECDAVVIIMSTMQREKIHTTPNIDPIVEWITSISRVLYEEGHEIIRACVMLPIKPERYYENRLRQLERFTRASAEEIAEALSVNSSSIGIAMRNTILRIGANNGFDAYPQYKYEGLQELENAGLIARHVSHAISPVEGAINSKPVHYALLPLGEMVYSKMNLKGIIRKEPMRNDPSL